MNACDFDLSSFFAKNLSVCGSGQTMFLPRCWFLSEVSPLFVCTSANKDLCLCAGSKSCNNQCVHCIFHSLSCLLIRGFPWSHVSTSWRQYPMRKYTCHSSYCYSFILLLHPYVRPSKQSITVNRSGKLYFLSRICFFSLIFKLALILNY